MNRRSPRLKPCGWRRWATVALTLPTLVWLAVMAMALAGLSAGEPLPTAGLPRVFLLDAATLVRTRGQMAAGADELSGAVARLRSEAQAALLVGPWSVTDKKFLPPSGDKHDYLSLGTYWWPDPGKPDGLPYVRRDGEVNPEGEAYDRLPLTQMTSAVETLALAYYFTGHEPYADHAARLLRVWFLDEATRMNPHLEYGQAIPGVTEGRGIGIIDTAQLVRLVDAVGLLGGAAAWTAADQQHLQTWFRRYLSWLRDSKHGRDEDRTENNHATWYDVQVAALALFVNEPQVAREVLQRAAQRRIAAQLEPDGRQPLELARTRSFDYSVMNLNGMFELAALGRHVGVDLWNFQTADGRGIRRALDWLIPYATGDKSWTDQQISGWNPGRLAPLLRRAAAVYHEPRYERVANQLAPDPADRLQLLWPG